MVVRFLITHYFAGVAEYGVVDFEDIIKDSWRIWENKFRRVKKWKKYYVELQLEQSERKNVPFTLSFTEDCKLYGVQLE